MTDLIGGSLGPYQIVEQIGAGGMATIYKAFQPAMQRYVAIKVLPAHLAGDPHTNFRERFRREANVIARLEHRYILPVYDVGEEGNISYLVMRYIDGGTLADLIAAGTLTIDRAVTLISQVAEALAYAHGQGVIHRDIKPANILIGRDGNALLSDFGIAKILEDTLLTSGYGVAIGTPAYMSPEQAEGKPIDARTDIYALGVVLYQALTGEPPFTAETPLAVMMMHLHNPLRPPRQVNPAISERLEQVMLRALAKRPEDRFPTAEAMAEALRDAGTPRMEAAPPTVPAGLPPSGLDPLPTDTPSKRSRPWLVLSAILSGLLILCVLILVLGFQAVRSLLQPQPTSLAVRPTTVEVDPTAVATPEGTAPQSTLAPPSVALANAIPINIGDEVQEDKPAVGAGKIEAPGTQDVYSFSAAAGQQVFFQLKAHEGLTYVNWRLEDQDGTVLFDQCLGCGEVGLQTLKRGGTYTLTVGGDKAPEIGSYAFQLVAQQ